MEREGEGMKKRGRRGGEKRKGRGIIVGGIAFLLVLGCNNGEIEKLENKNKFLGSVVNLGNEFLNVFTSFGDMVGGVLGFSEKTKKSEVGEYFKKVKETVEGTKDKLNKIVENMKAENNPNAVGVETAVKTLVTEKLDKIIDGANKVKEAIGDDTGLIADFGSSGVGAAGEGKSVEALTEGIKKIVDVVLKDKGDPEAGTDKKADALSGNRGTSAGTGEAGKLFATSAISDSNEKKSAADAAKAVGAVTGADILQAIAKNSDSAKLAEGTDGSATKNPKDGTIAGAVALRAMSKKGKFANKSNDDPDVKKAVGDAAISAIIKALDTLTIAIRKTIDEGLKDVKESMKLNTEGTTLNIEAKN